MTTDLNCDTRRLSATSTITRRSSIGKDSLQNEDNGDGEQIFPLGKESVITAFVWINSQHTYFKINGRLSFSWACIFASCSRFNFSRNCWVSGLEANALLVYQSESSRLTEVQDHWLVSERWLDRLIHFCPRAARCSTGGTSSYLLSSDYRQ